MPPADKPQKPAHRQIALIVVDWPLRSELCCLATFFATPGRSRMTCCGDVMTCWMRREGGPDGRFQSRLESRLVTSSCRRQQSMDAHFCGGSQTRLLVKSGTMKPRYDDYELRGAPDVEEPRAQCDSRSRTAPASAHDGGCTRWWSPIGRGRGRSSHRLSNARSAPASRVATCSHSLLADMRDRR